MKKYFFSKTKSPAGPRIIFLYLLIACLAPTFSFAQNGESATGKNKAIPIDGTVTDQSTGQALAGVSITIKGNNIGTSTDANGVFKINASSGNTLVFTFVGYVQLEIQVDSRTHYDASLVPKSNQLNAVVVTALGIKRSEKSLSYASQQIAAMN